MTSSLLEKLLIVVLFQTRNLEKLFCCFKPEIGFRIVNRVTRNHCMMDKIILTQKKTKLCNFDAAKYEIESVSIHELNKLKSKNIHSLN